MSTMFRINQFQPKIDSKNTVRQSGKTENNNQASFNEKIVNKEAKPQPLSPEQATQKLEQEIAQTEQGLKSKLDHLVKIYEQLGENGLGNPHSQNIAQLLNSQLPPKGSVSPEEGIKILEARLAQLQQASADIDNDIREATLRLIQQQNSVIGGNGTINGGGLAASQARLIYLTRT